MSMLYIKYLEKLIQKLSYVRVFMYVMKSI
jgi:hypothetical protein